MMQPLQQALIDVLIAERQLFRCIFQYIANDVFEHGFCTITVVFQIGKGHLRLDHPEFGGMPGCIRIFRPKRRTEGIGIAEGHGKRLLIDLSADGQKGSFVKKILGVINASVRVLRHILQIQRGDFKHFAGTLRIGRGDERRMHIDKSILLKELMDRIGNQRPDAEHGGKRIRARTQMRNGAQIFHGMPFFLQRVIRSRQPLNSDLPRLHFKRLPGIRCLYDHSSCNDGASDI